MTNQFDLKNVRNFGLPIAFNSNQDSKIKPFIIYLLLQFPDVIDLLFNNVSSNNQEIINLLQQCFIHSIIDNEKFIDITQLLDKINQKIQILESAKSNGALLYNTIKFFQSCFQKNEKTEFLLGEFEDNSKSIKTFEVMKLDKQDRLIYQTLLNKTQNMNITKLPRNLLFFFNEQNQDNNYYFDKFLYSEILQRKQNAQNIIEQTISKKESEFNYKTKLQNQQSFDIVINYFNQQKNRPCQIIQELTKEKQNQNPLVLDQLQSLSSLLQVNSINQYYISCIILNTYAYIYNPYKKIWYKYADVVTYVKEDVVMEDSYKNVICLLYVNKNEQERRIQLTEQIEKIEKRVISSYNICYETMKDIDLIKKIGSKLFDEVTTRY